MPPLDSMSPDGAKILADQIEQFWAERGGRVAVRVEVSTVRSGSRVAAVRSDMVGGLPRDWMEK